MVEIYDPDASSPSGLVAGAAHSTTISYTSSVGLQPGMVASIEDGMGSNAATTSYSYTNRCASGECLQAGGSQTTTILYPAECPNPTTTCTSTSWPTATADIPEEIDQYSNGLETSTQLGSQTNASEVETWLYSWNLGNGIANTSEVITYPHTSRFIWTAHGVDYYRPGGQHHQHDQRARRRPRHLRTTNRPH